MTIIKIGQICIVRTGTYLKIRPTSQIPWPHFHSSISHGFVTAKKFDKRDDFYFDIVNFLFLDGDVSRSTSYAVYISQLIRFALVSIHVDDFNTRDKDLTAKLLKQRYRYHKLRKAFSKLDRWHVKLVYEYNVGLETLLLPSLSEPECFGDFYANRTAN